MHVVQLPSYCRKRKDTLQCVVCHGGECKHAQKAGMRPHGTLRSLRNGEPSMLTYARRWHRSGKFMDLSLRIGRPQREASLRCSDMSAGDENNNRKADNTRIDNITSTRSQSCTTTRSAHSTCELLNSDISPARLATATASQSSSDTRTT